jgi:hypothetical protein
MPGQNTVFLSVMSDELAQQVTEKLKELVDSFEERRRPALRVFATPAEILLYHVVKVARRLFPYRKSRFLYGTDSSSIPTT